MHEQQGGDQQPVLLGDRMPGKKEGADDQHAARHGERIRRPRAGPQADHQTRGAGKSREERRRSRRAQEQPHHVPIEERRRLSSKLDGLDQHLCSEYGE